MTLQGNLDTLTIADVLKLLAATHKTGCLRIQSNGGQATVWMRDGAVTACATDRVPDGPFDEVVSDLLRYENGSFVFDVDDRAPDGEKPGPVEDLLDRAPGMLAEWEDLRAAVPSLNCRLGLTENLANEQVTITARQWPALTAVADGCSVKELAASLGLTELGVLRTLNDLQSRGLTSIQAPQPPLPGTRPAALG